MLNTIKSFMIAIVLLGTAFSCAPDKSQGNSADGIGNYESGPNAFIIGGQDLSRSSQLNRSLVVIMNQQTLGGFSLCTGTFITKDIILTAAHCVPENKEDLVVKMGNSFFSETTAITFPVVQIVKHDEYQKGKNDLALIQIKNSQNTKIIPIPLASEKEVMSKKNIILYGYGVNQVEESADEFQGAGDLRKLHVAEKQISQNENKIKIDQSKGSGACHGDSGGPAFIFDTNKNMILVGVASGVSQAQDEIDCTNQSIYTKVAAYNSWIIKSIRDLNANNQL